MAVAIVDLDAGREIHDVQVILGINGRRTRFDEVAVLHAALTPDEFRLVGMARTAPQRQQEAPHA